MSNYFFEITPLVNDLIVRVTKPNMAYIEAMSALTESVMVSIDPKVDKADIAFVHETTLSSLTKLKAELSSLKTRDGFAEILEQLIHLHTELLAD